MFSFIINKFRCWIINTNTIFYLIFLLLIGVLFDSGIFLPRLSLDELAQGRMVKYERGKGPKT